MPSHFEFTGETLEHKGHLLHRIRAARPGFFLEAGELGGWIESEANLEDHGWVTHQAKVYGNAKITGRAIVGFQAEVFDAALVTDEATIWGDVQVCDHAVVSGSTYITGGHRITGNTIITGCSTVAGNFTFSGGIVTGNSQLVGIGCLPTDVEILNGSDTFVLPGITGVRTYNGFQLFGEIPIAFMNFVQQRLDHWHAYPDRHYQEANYEFTGKTREFQGREVHQIRLVNFLGHMGVGEIGTIGGWIESHSNLSGNAWVYPEAVVCGNATVSGYAQIHGNSVIKDDAIVLGTAEIHGSTIGGSTIVGSCAEIYGGVLTGGEVSFAKLSLGDRTLPPDIEIFDDSHLTEQAVRQKSSPWPVDFPLVSKNSDKQATSKRHFEFTGESMLFDGHTLHRIRLIRPMLSHDVAVGTVGGWIEQESNIQSDEAWVADNAKVYGWADIHDGVLIGESARVCEFATVNGSARVTGTAVIDGDATVDMWAHITDNAHITANAEITGHAVIGGNCVIGDFANVTDNAVCTNPHHVLYLSFTPSAESLTIYRTRTGIGMSLDDRQISSFSELDRILTDSTDWDAETTARFSAEVQTILPALKQHTDSWH